MKTMLIAAVTAIALLTGAGCAVTRKQETVGSYVDDTTITTQREGQVRQRQDRQRNGHPGRNAEGYGAALGLRQVARREETAEQLARSVNGVVDVKNDIVVRA